MNTLLDLLSSPLVLAAPPWEKVDYRGKFSSYDSNQKGQLQKFKSKK